MSEVSPAVKEEPEKRAVCDVCMHACSLNEGDTGACRARRNIEGAIRPVNYGRVTSLALDPIEKKPLKRFRPGSLILSVGSFGCNLRCAFCQNHEISQQGGDEVRNYEYTPHELCETAKRARDEEGNIGLAYTYNEPLVGYEFVRDTARLVRERGMYNVMVTNGTAELSVLEELLPYIDAMNVDLKGFTDSFYSGVLKGSREQTMRFIERAARDCHVEVTTLIIPGENDSEDEMRQISGWIAGLYNGADIPLHISRFFPRFNMTDRAATGVELIYRLAGTAREKLRYVYTGNC